MTGRSTAGGAGAGPVHDVRVVPAALLSWAAAWWAVGTAAEQGRLLAGLLLGVGGVAALVLALAPALAARPARVALVRGAAAAVVVACALPALVLGVTSWHAERRAPEVVTDLAGSSRTALVLLEVAGDPVTGRGEQAWQREQVRLEVVLLEVVAPGVPRGTHQVRVPASLSGDEAWASARWGERLRVRLSLRPAPAGAPYTVLASPAGPVEVVSGPRWWWRAAERLRAGLVVAAGAGGERPGDAAVLLPGLVVGDTAAQPPELVDDMRTAGLTHLTAVSGANVSIVCGGVLLLCVLLRLGQRAGVVLAAVALVALVVVARPEPSVLRAAVMGSVGLLALLLGRRGGGLSALSLAVVVVLLADPWLARAPGFRLSVLATGALVVCSMPWARALGRQLPRGPALVLAVPAAAQAAVTPALVGLDPVLSLYALPANVLAAPVVAPATVVGVLAAVLSLLHPGAAALLAVPALWCTGWIALVARTAADLPAAALPWPGGTPGVIAAAAATAVLLLLVGVLVHLLPDRRAGGTWAPWPDLRGVVGLPAAVARSVAAGRPRGATVLGAATALALTLAWALPGAGGSRWPGEDWAAVVCDVGQGESVLVRAGPAAAVVVDTGPGPEAVTGCLRRAGVSEVPLLVLTHLHADHVGGLDGVLAVAPPGRVWAPSAGMPEQARRDLAAWTTDHGLGLEHPGRGTSVRTGGVRLDVLAPATARGPAGGSQDVNDAGIVLRVGAGALTLLVLGDVGSEVQRALLGSGVDLAADVTTVAHHGSADQLPAFYAAVGARVAVASAGRDNDYGHPSPRAQDVVAGSGAQVLSTAVHGDVALRVVPGSGAGAGAGAGSGVVGPVGAGDGAAAPELAVRTTRQAPRRRARVPA